MSTTQQATRQHSGAPREKVHQREITVVKLGLSKAADDAATALAHGAS